MPLRNKRKTVKQQIEWTPQIATHEMQWYKSPRTELRPAAKYRFPHGVEPLNPNPADKSDIHSHPWQKKHSLKSALPSVNDIESWSKTARNTGIRAFHIASINQQGKVTGYFHCHFTRHFIELMKDPKKEEEFVRGLVHIEFNPREIREFLQFMAKNKYIKYHLKPMPGHKYENGKFVKSEGI